MDLQDKLKLKLNQYKTPTQANKRAILNKFFQHQGYKQDYNEYDALQYINHAKEKYSPNSVAQIYGVLQWFYKRILNKDISQDVVRPEPSNYKTPVLEFEDVIKMIQHAKEMKPLPCALMAMASTYGVRREEMYRIEPEHIDLNNSLIYISTAKKGLRRWTLIPQEIYPYLLRWKFRYFMVKLPELSAYFHKIVIDSGVNIEDIPHIGWHSIRRRIIFELTKYIDNDYTINTFLRWSSAQQGLSMLYKYRSMASEDELVEQVDKKIFEVHPFLKYWKK